MSIICVPLNAPLKECRLALVIQSYLSLLVSTNLCKNLEWWRKSDWWVSSLYRYMLVCWIYTEFPIPSCRDVFRKSFWEFPPASVPLLQLATAKAGAGELPKQTMTKSHKRWDGKLCKQTERRLFSCARINFKKMKYSERWRITGYESCRGQILEHSKGRYCGSLFCCDLNAHVQRYLL